MLNLVNALYCGRPGLVNILLTHFRQSCLSNIKEDTYIHTYIHVCAYMYMYIYISICLYLYTKKYKMVICIIHNV